MNLSIRAYLNKCYTQSKISTLLIVGLKGGYLDFPHLTELKNIYITEIYNYVKTI